MIAMNCADEKFQLKDKYAVYCMLKVCTKWDVYDKWNVLNYRFIYT